MKKILISGANSYIGTSFEKWLLQWTDKYSTDTLDVIDDRWKDKDFSKYDVVFHVAGIAHIKETKENRDLYYKVNRDLAYEVAKKAKSDGVKQFIFLSSMSVYGKVSGKINKESILKPESNYGKSKLQAEQLLLPLEDNAFKIVIVRPPMVYGKGCKGNYPKLAKLALNLRLFPDIDNQRSMLHIENLCEFIRLMVDNSESGLFFPQNREYVKTTELVRMISEVHGEKIKTTKIFNPLIKLFRGLIGIINKVFGDLVYDKSISEYKENYCINDFKESIIKTEV